MNRDKSIQRISTTLALEPQRLSAHPAELDTSETARTFSHYLWILRRQWWKIAAFVAVSAIAAVLISARLTPVYEATATVDIDRQGPTGVIGQEAARSTSNDADQFLATQIRLLQSDSVLRPVVNRLKLRQVEPDGFDSPGGPSVREDGPISLRRLKIHRPPSTYLLLISYRSSDPRLAAAVANGVAQSYVEHTWNIRFRTSASLSSFMEKQLDELRAKMERSGSALMRFEREMNVINPEERTSILSARLVQLNTEYTTAQAERVRKEAAWNSTRGGSIEAAQVSGQGEALKRIAERLDEAMQKFAEVKAHFGVNHPEYRRSAGQVAEIERQLNAARENIRRRVEVDFQQASARERILEKAVAEQKAEMDRINSRSLEYQALKREADADKRLYEELVHKIREAGINASFQNNSIRLADPARPPVRPVSPNIPLNALLAVIFSAVLAIGAVVVCDVLDDTIRDPEQVAGTMDAQVVATLPWARESRVPNAFLPSSKDAESSLVPAGAANRDKLLSGYAEAIRTLRNTLLLSDFDRRLRSILVTSAVPSEGKSTAAAHLALAHAEQGLKTLLIDGDLRRPSIARRFHLQARSGLSNVLMDEVPWRDVLVKSPSAECLDILAAGPPSPRAADLIGRGLFEVLEEATREYDLVVLDGPPLPGFAEPLQMATAVDGVLIIARAGQTSRKAVGNVVETLRRLRVNVLGVVLNEVRKDTSQNYYYYGQYSKHYSMEKAS